MFGDRDNTHFIECRCGSPEDIAVIRFDPSDPDDEVAFVEFQKQRIWRWYHVFTHPIQFWRGISQEREHWQEIVLGEDDLIELRDKIQEVIDQRKNGRNKNE